MKAYTEFSRETGEIIRSVFVPDGFFFVPSNGMDFLPGHYPDDQFRMENGLPIKKDAVNVTALEPHQPIHSEAQHPVSDWDVLRINRNILLAQSDWTQLPDSGADKEAWAVYRKALRDLPETTVDPANPAWPIPPV